MTNTPASDAYDANEDGYDYYDDDDWYDDEEKDYDPAYDFDDYGEDEYDYYGDSDEWNSEPPTVKKRVFAELAYRKYKITEFVRAWTGARLRNRFRRCPDCGRRNEPYWSDNDKVCSRCVIPF